MPMPAVSLAAGPGKRARALEMASEIERRGFPGIYCPSLGDALGLCTSLAHVTSTIRFGTAIEPIYLRHPTSMAQTASYIHEVSGGRFDLGLGVSHGPVHAQLRLEVGRPLSDMRDYVGGMRAAGDRIGELPPIVLATLRDRMVALAAEVADGAVWANGSRSHMAASLATIPEERRAKGFFVGNMIPTVIDDDRAAAAAINRRTLSGYVALPNYRNYWKAAGYVEEMEAIEAAIAAGERDKVPGLMSDKWLADCTLFGTATDVRDGVDAWFDAGVTTPIVVMSSTKGGQFVAIEQLFEVYS
jgi:alkanesulfonate monooxygenase SsuD/methylene tetrahydromethanopterin reductase-like flavin-dependent oxidoreductase (luciferase family)